MNMDGEELFQPINLDRLCKYYMLKKKKKTRLSWKPKKAA